MRREVICFAVWLQLSFVGQVLPAEPCRVTGLHVGVEGNYRVGHWTQVRVDIESPTPLQNARLELVLPDGEGVPTVMTYAGLSLGATPTTTLEVFAKFGRVRCDVSVRLFDDLGTLIATRRFTADELAHAALGSQQLVLTLGTDIGVGEVIASQRQRPEQETRHAVIHDPRSLPSRWHGYQGTRLLVLAGSEAFVSGLSPSQRTALERWVRMGGRLLLCAGASAAATVGDDGPLANLLPGTLDRIQMQRQTTAIEGFAGNTAKSLDAYTSADELNFRLPMAVLADLRGTVEVAEGIGGERTPAIVRASLGFGHVIFVAMDLDRPPISQWQDGRRKILAKLLEMSLEDVSHDDADRQFAKLTQIGFDDLIGQLRAGLDQFTNVLLVPFSWIGVLVTVYLLLIGPVDYFLLRSWQRRFGLTWLTFPLLVVLGCASAYTLSQTWKGNALRVHQIDVVDIDTESHLTRRNTWSHVFSPASRSYDIQTRPAEKGFAVHAPRGHLTSWQGLPGKSFGGMNTSRVNTSAITYKILCDFGNASQQSATIAGIPIDVYASRGFSSVAWGQIEPSVPEPLTADADNQLSGRIRNPLPVSLRDCRLCFGRWVYPLPSLAAGAVVELDRFSKVKTIDGMLTRTQVDQNFKDKSQPWDRKSLDIERIMEMMMFHKAAGGSEYTSLLHRFQSDIDFTDHLTEGKAILVGKTDEPASTILDEDQVQRQTHTFYRILLPVSTQQRR